MPHNKRESLIFTVLMCAFMVFFMSVYNVTLHNGFSWETVKDAWLGFPIAYIVGMICDWFIVSHIAKKAAFTIVSPSSKDIVKIIAVSTGMVCGMVILMSLYGAFEAVGISSKIGIVWLTNIPKNFIVAFPLQLLIAGPVIRFTFRKLFPVGKVLA